MMGPPGHHKELTIRGTTGFSKFSRKIMKLGIC